MSDLKLATVPCPDLRSIRGNAFSFRTHMFMSFPLRGGKYSLFTKTFYKH